MNIQELLQHMQWADASIWQAVTASPAAREDAEIKERLHHTHLVQWAFLQIWRQEDLALRELSAFETLDGLLAWARQYFREMPSHVADLAPAAFQEEVRLPWSDKLNERFGDAGPTLLGETMTQVALHTMHHRGQVSARLRAIGGEPPLLDYIAWLWQKRPQPQWPEADG